MPKLTFTPAELKAYFTGETKHHFYTKTVAQVEDMMVHSDGIYPEKLLKTRRPNEPAEVMEYRQKIWVPKTKPVFGKVLNSLSKIRRSADWSIKFENIEEFSKIEPEESLKVYGEEQFPYFTSLTNWLFSVALKHYLVDPNAVVFVSPLEIVTEVNQFIRPFPVIFNSCDVIDFVQEDYAVLHNPLGSTYYVRGKAQKGRSFYIITTESINRFDQISSKANLLVLTDTYPHNLAMLPVFRIGAVIADSEGHDYLYESRIAVILPELDEAVREYSDLQAAKVLHVYPERWEYTQNECRVCNGTSRRRNPHWFVGCGGEIPKEIDCDNPTCSNGYVVAGPYSKIMIRPVNSGMETQNIPAPPAGFVEKDIEIVKIQEEGIEKHIMQGLAAINFEFLMQSPLNQSGTAKEVDKDELNNTVHAVAEDLVSVMDRIYKFIGLYRYSVLYTPEDIIDRMLPKITVPEKFDILSTNHLEKELADAKTNKINPILQNALEIEYANKKFNNDPDVRDRLQLILELDPLANVTEDDKMTRKSNGGITEEAYIISSNIVEFVQRAMDEDEKFSGLALKVQKAKMSEYAVKLLEAIDEAKKMATELIADTGLDPDTEEIQPDEEVIEPTP